MAYKINNTFGTLLVTLADGTIDTTTTDLTLIGKGYAGFGEKLNENLVKLLENETVGVIENVLGRLINKIGLLQFQLKRKLNNNSLKACFQDTSYDMSEFSVTQPLEDDNSDEDSSSSESSSESDED